MSCYYCNSFDYQTHASANHKIHLCNVCERTFGDFQTHGYCCEYKNVKIVEYELSNKQKRKANMCINCLTSFGNVKQATSHFMSVTYDERQDIRCSIKKEKSDLFIAIFEKKRHYKQLYYEYLQSDKWKQKRLERLKLDNFTCQKCGNKSGRLDVHHTTYDTLYNESIYDIITLCHPCHFKLHEND